MELMCLEKDCSQDKLGCLYCFYDEDCHLDHEYEYI